MPAVGDIVPFFGNVVLLVYEIQTCFDRHHILLKCTIGVSLKTGFTGTLLVN